MNKIFFLEIDLLFVLSIIVQKNPRGEIHTHVY